MSLPAKGENEKGVSPVPLAAVLRGNSGAGEAVDGALAVGHRFIMNLGSLVVKG